MPSGSFFQRFLNIYFCRRWFQKSQKYRKACKMKQTGRYRNKNLYHFVLFLSFLLVYIHDVGIFYFHFFLNIYFCRTLFRTYQLQIKRYSKSFVFNCKCIINTCRRDLLFSTFFKHLLLQDMVSNAPAIQENLQDKQERKVSKQNFI